MTSATPEAGSIDVGASASVNGEAKEGVLMMNCVTIRLQPRKARSSTKQDVQRCKTWSATAVAPHEEPHQRHRGVDAIADHNIDFLNINWQLFNDFACRVNMETPPFQLPRRKVDLERQVIQDQACGIVTQLFVLRQNEKQMKPIYHVICQNACDIKMSATAH